MCVCGRVPVYINFSQAYFPFASVLGFIAIGGSSSFGQRMGPDCCFPFLLKSQDNTQLGAQCSFRQGGEKQVPASASSLIDGWGQRGLSQVNVLSGRHGL